MYALIFMDNGLGNCPKGFRDRTLFCTYLGKFNDYRVNIPDQFTDTNQFMHGCLKGNILGFQGT